MKILQLIANALLNVHNGNNWTDVTIESTLEDVTWKEAVTVTPASPNTIATLLHHISFWNRAVAQRGKGIKPLIGEDNGFDMPPLKNEKDWKALIKDNIASAKELAEVIRNFDETKLNKPILPRHSSAYSNFQGQVEHVHYHLGQMVMIKQLLRTH